MLNNGASMNDLSFDDLMARIEALDPSSPENYQALSEISQALKAHPPEKVLGRLTDILCTHKESGVRLNALSVIQYGFAGHPGLLNRIQDIYYAQTDKNIKSSVLFLCGGSDKKLHDFLIKIYQEDVSLESRTAVVSTIGYSKNPADLPFLIDALQKEPDTSYLRSNLIFAIGTIGSKEGVGIIAETLHNQKLDQYTRENAARALGSINDISSFHELTKSLTNDVDKNVRKVSAEIIQASQAVEWVRKIDAVLQALQNKDRSDIDPEVIFTAIKPSETQAKTGIKITEYLIEKAIKSKGAFLGILAALIVESTDGNPTLAAAQVSRYAEKNRITDNDLQDLRIEIGGKAALDPIMQSLRSDLHQYFRVPISNLNELTQENWKKTIRYAQIGFIAKIAMSVVVFLVGIVLLSLSAWRIMFNQLEASQLFGTSVSFISGIGAILLIIYSGPLIEIRDSVNELGIASAAFIAYVHRVLQISHTFSLLYLKQEISFEQLRLASELIEDAMKDTTSQLASRNDKSSQTMIENALQAIKTSASK